MSSSENERRRTPVGSEGIDPAPHTIDADEPVMPDRYYQHKHRHHKHTYTEDAADVIREKPARQRSREPEEELPHTPMMQPAASDLEMSFVMPVDNGDRVKPELLDRKLAAITPTERPRRVGSESPASREGRLEAAGPEMSFVAFDEETRDKSAVVSDSGTRILQPEDTDLEPSYVMPVEKEDRVKPEKLDRKLAAIKPAERKVKVRPRVAPNPNAKRIKPEAFVAEPSFVMPVEKEDRVKPEKLDRKLAAIKPTERPQRPKPAPPAPEPERVAPAPIPEMQSDEPVAPVPEEERIKPPTVPPTDARSLAFECVTPAMAKEGHASTHTGKTKFMKSSDNAVDYVMPSTVEKGHSSTHKGKTKNLSEEEIKDAESGFVFRSHSSSSKKHHHHHHHHRHHHRRMKKVRKILLITLCVLLGIVIALVSTFFILKEVGRRSLHNYDNIEIVAPTTPDTKEEIMEVIDNGRTVIYEGKTYTFNEDVVCIAFIGINRDEDDQGYLMAPMADSINLIAMDTETGKMSLIAVSRDTMTDVRIYSSEGKLIDSEITQLSYAYSFDGKDVSGGENTAASLSKLFYGLPVNHYFAINMEALKDLNDAIGGVTLTSSIDFDTDLRHVSKGQTVTLTAREVDVYVRTREHDADGNTGRMQRQQEYIKAFLAQVIPAVKKNLSLVTDLYGIISHNSSSNIDLPKIVYLASEMAPKLGSAADIGFTRIQGEAKAGDEHAEFYADDKNVLETMLRVFYQTEE